MKLARKAPAKLRKKNSYNTRRVKATYGYTMQEIAALFGIHKNTVRQWMREGLGRIDSKKPFLFHGRELIRFLKQRQAARKNKCRPDEFYCFRCRKPHRPQLGSVTVRQRNQRIVDIVGKCGDCGTALNKVGSAANLAEISKIFASPTPEEERIEETVSASVHCHLQGNDRHEEHPSEKRAQQMELFPPPEGGSR